MLGGGFLFIEIERGLEELKNELENRGYKTFYSGEDKVADAILYSGAIFPLSTYEGSPVRVSSHTNRSSSNGALLLNVDNKNIDEIIQILNKRSYGSLF